MHQCSGGRLEANEGEGGDSEEDGESGDGDGRGGGVRAAVDLGGGSIIAGDADSDGVSRRVGEGAGDASVGVNGLDDGAGGAGRLDVDRNGGLAIKVATIEEGGTKVGGNRVRGGALAGGASESLHVGVVVASGGDRGRVEGASGTSGDLVGLEGSVTRAGVARGIGEVAEVDNRSRAAAVVVVETDTSGVVDSLSQTGASAGVGTRVDIVDVALGAAVASSTSGRVGTGDAGGLVGNRGEEHGVGHVDSAGRAVKARELAGQVVVTASGGTVASSVIVVGEGNVGDRKERYGQKSNGSNGSHP